MLPPWSWDTVRKLLLLGLLSSVLGLFFVAQTLGPTIAIKASYTSIGLVAGLVALTVHRRSSRGVPHLGGLDIRRLEKLGGIAILLGFVLILLANRVLVALAVVFPFGFLCLYGQFLRRGSADWKMLLQVVGLFVAIGSAKLSTTHFYVGYLDLMKHSRFTRILYETGRAGEIPSIYDGFPIVHALAGAIASITGLPVYETLPILGLSAFGTLLVPLYWLLERYLADEGVAFVAVLLFSASPLFLFYGNYFYPQSLALVFLFLLVSLAVAWPFDPRYRAIVGLPIGAALTFTHHFSFLLLIPVVATLLVGDVLRRSGDYSLQLRDWALLAIPYLFAVYYWGREGRGFLDALFVVTGAVATRLLQDTVATGDSFRYQLGTYPLRPTVADSVAFLYSPEGVFQITLVAAVALSTGCLLQSRRTPAYRLPVFALGYIGTVLLLEIPIPIKSAERLAFPLSLFVFVVIAYGLEALRRGGSPARSLVTAVLICSLVVTGPIIGTQDVLETAETDPPQTSIPRDQFAQSTATVGFLDRYDVRQVSTYLVFEELIKYLGYDQTGFKYVTNRSFATSDPLLYNERWPQYRLRYSESESPYLHRIRMSDWWLERYVGSRTKVYDAGSVGLLGSPGSAPRIPSPPRDRTGDQRLGTR